MTSSIKKATAILFISATAATATVTPSFACQGSFCSDRAREARDAYAADQAYKHKHQKSLIDQQFDQHIGQAFKWIGKKMIECKRRSIPITQCDIDLVTGKVSKNPQLRRPNSKPGKPNGSHVSTLPLAKATPPTPFKNAPQANSFIQKLIAAGDPRVAQLLGIYLWVGTELTGMNEKRGCDLFQATYNKFHKNPKEQGAASVSAYMLGSCHYYGYGRDIDFQKALKWYKASSDIITTKPSLAYYAIGLMHYRGQGVAADKQKAKEFWTRAVNICGPVGCKQAKESLAALSF